MDQVIHWLVEDYLISLLESLTSPGKRVSVAYLLSAIVIAILWSTLTFRDECQSNLVASLKRIFSTKIWFSKSAKADYLLLVINRVIMGIATPLLVSRILVTTLLFYFFQRYFTGASAIFSELPAWIAPVSYTLFLFILDDFSRYLVHRALHQIPILWAFHKIHHTAEHLTPFTVFRTHPVEAWIFSLRSTAVQAIAISSFVFLFGSKIDLVTLYGVNIFLFIFNVSGANLRHSNVSISYGRYLERLFISPAQHQIHHSIAFEHRNKNFGVVFAFWDWLGNSLFIANSNQELSYGISGHLHAENHSLLYMYLSPFKEIAQFGGKYYWNFSKKVKCLFQVRSFGRLGKGISSLLLFIFFVGSNYPSNGWSKEINIYSHRQPFLIEPFLKAFQQETGIKSNIVFSSKGLAQRLLAEGKRSPADVVLTVDISRLSVYADKNLLAPISSEILNSNIPRHLRDPKNRWFGLSKRARIVAVDTNRVNFKQIKRIEDLANPEWRGRICSRPGSHVYNRALLASIIAAKGESLAESWAKGLVSNLARRPQGNDRAQIKAIYQGVCNIAIINSYYFGKLRNSKIIEQRKWTNNVKIIFTNQEGRGNHINISGGGVAKFSRNKVLATRFLEFLSGVKAQKLYARINYEFPANQAVGLSDELRSWGSFREDKLPIGVIAELSPMAQRIIDRIGW